MTSQFRGIEKATKNGGGLVHCDVACPIASVRMEASTHKDKNRADAKTTVLLYMAY